MKYYKIMGEIDPTTSLGTYLIGLCVSHERAEKLAAGKGLWGAPGYIIEVEIEDSFVFGSYYYA